MKNGFKQRLAGEGGSMDHDLKSKVFFSYYNRLILYTDKEKHTDTATPKWDVSKHTANQSALNTT